MHMARLSAGQTLTLRVRRRGEVNDVAVVAAGVAVPCRQTVPRADASRAPRHRGRGRCASIRHPRRRAGLAAGDVITLVAEFRRADAGAGPAVVRRASRRAAPPGRRHARQPSLRDHRGTMTSPLDANPYGAPDAIVDVSGVERARARRGAARGRLAATGGVVGHLGARGAAAHCRPRDRTSGPQPARPRRIGAARSGGAHRPRRAGRARRAERARSPPVLPPPVVGAAATMIVVSIGASDSGERDGVASALVLDFRTGQRHLRGELPHVAADRSAGTAVDGHPHHRARRHRSDRRWRIRCWRGSARSRAMARLRSWRRPSAVTLAASRCRVVVADARGIRDGGTRVCRLRAAARGRRRRRPVAVGAVRRTGRRAVLAVRGRAPARDDHAGRALRAAPPRRARAAGGRRPCGILVPVSRASGWPISLLRVVGQLAGGNLTRRAAAGEAPRDLGCTCCPPASSASPSRLNPAGVAGADGAILLAAVVMGTIGSELVAAAAAATERRSSEAAARARARYRRDGLRTRASLPDDGGSAATALALGFALMGASIAGDALRRFHLPRLTGYLLFGVDRRPVSREPDHAGDGRSASGRHRHRHDAHRASSPA